MKDSGAYRRKLIEDWNKVLQRPACMYMHTLIARRKAKRDDIVKSRRVVTYDARGIRLTIQSNKE